MFERLTILCLCGALILGCGNSTAIEAGQGNEGSSIDAEGDTSQANNLATTTTPDEQKGKVPTDSDGSPEANSTSALPYNDDSDIVLPRPELDISAEFYENLNKPETPITSLCWVMREVSLQHLLIVALDDDEATQNAEAVRYWIKSDVPGLITVIEGIQPALEQDVAAFADLLVDDLKEALRQPDSPKASAAELLDFLRLGGEEGEEAYLAYAEAAETGGCAQMV